MTTCMDMPRCCASDTQFRGRSSGSAQTSQCRARHRALSVSLSLASVVCLCETVCASVCTGHDTVYTDPLLRGWHLREPTKYTQGSGQRAASLSLSRCHIFLLIELSSSRPPPPPHPPIPAPRRSKPETCATHAHTPRAGSRPESAPRHQLLHLRITPACEVAWG